MRLLLSFELLNQIQMIKVGSLFSGIGDIDLGFVRAGFEIARANDIDAEASKSCLAANAKESDI